MIKKKIPKFSNEDVERDFWATPNSGRFIDWRQARRLTLQNLKPSTRTIAAQLPDDLNLLANKRDAPYQSLLKIFLAGRIKQEFGS